MEVGIPFYSRLRSLWRKKSRQPEVYLAMMCSVVVCVVFFTVVLHLMHRDLMTNADEDPTRLTNRAPTSLEVHGHAKGDVGLYP